MNSIIYKYLLAERKTYFEDELLRFTQPRYLNDPFECLPAKWTDLEIINKIRSENPNYKFSRNAQVQTENFDNTPSSYKLALNSCNKQT